MRPHPLISPGASLSPCPPTCSGRLLQPSRSFRTLACPAGALGTQVPADSPCIPRWLLTQSQRGEHREGHPSTSRDLRPRRNTAVAGLRPRVPILVPGSETFPGMKRQGLGERGGVGAHRVLPPQAPGHCPPGGGGRNAVASQGRAPALRATLSEAPSRGPHGGGCPSDAGRPVQGGDRRSVDLEAPVRSAIEGG